MSLRVGFYYVWKFLQNVQNRGPRKGQRVSPLQFHIPHSRISDNEYSWRRSGWCRRFQPSVAQSGEPLCKQIIQVWTDPRHQWTPGPLRQAGRRRRRLGPNTQGIGNHQGQGHHIYSHAVPTRDQVCTWDGVELTRALGLAPNHV